MLPIVINPISFLTSLRNYIDYLPSERLAREPIYALGFLKSPALPAMTKMIIRINIITPPATIIVITVAVQKPFA